jgi:hypothetical protein
MKINNERGSLLVMTLLLVAVLLTLGSAFVAMSMAESRIAERERRSVIAFHIAEAGIARAVYDLREDFWNDPSSPSWADGDINGNTLNLPDTTNFYAMPYVGTTLNGGSYSVQVKKETADGRGISMRATGTLGDASETIQVYAKMTSVSPWDNAIFAGTGSDPGTGATTIAGCVNISGSVHILGTGLSSTDYAVELGGTAELIGNNYSALAADLRRRLPALPTTVYNGETVETLSAILRVKHGLVGLDGNSSVGTTNVPGNSVKETADAVYSTDGFTGNSGIANVYSDNGWSNAYDMGDDISFPSLSDPYGGYASYQQYLRDNAYVISDPADLAFLSNITAASSFTLTDAGGKGSISMDGSGHLTVDGIIYVEGGNMSFGGGSDIIYTGKASILVTGNINVETNLVTPAVPIGGEHNFPYVPSTGVENIIGFMTPNNIALGTSSQLDVMGLFYGENKISINKQTDLMGSIVTNFFDLTGQVPNIYQVPEAKNYLPPGMIGSTGGWNMALLSWQRI